MINKYDNIHDLFCNLKNEIQEIYSKEICMI